MAAYRRVDDLRSPVGWLPVHRDQLRAQHSVSSMGSLYLYRLVLDIKAKMRVLGLGPVLAPEALSFVVSLAGQVLGFGLRLSVFNRQRHQTKLILQMKFRHHGFPVVPVSRDVPCRRHNVR